ncbi:amidohydrolase [Microbacterium fluvii]|uniref:Amidohydrolase n=1 Tax=Microbacterium fluvii TaxID=415215 RepID=A0ABW2HEX4_9MICO|nr:amidohydrolase family protein [Microbacterium fluvii]MCU4673465.1 amidohydrolase family protein [Microbacterium fluvii]
MPEQIDLLVRAGRVLTPAVLAGDEAAAAGFVAVRGDTIVAVGSESDADAWAAHAHRVVDVGTGCLTAGIVDAHIHPVGGIRMTRGVDLSGIQDLAAARAALAAEAAASDGWVLGWGLDPNAFGDAAPSAALFDGATGDRPAFVQLFDGHSAVASRAALAAAGITGAERFPDGSSVAIDAAGSPTGFLLELSAMALAQRVIPEQSFDERVEALGGILGGMAACGVTSGQMLDLFDDDAFELLDELERRGDLPLRLRISPMVAPGSTEADLEELLALQGRHGRRWHVAGIKLMIDGTIDNGTAWLFEPDALGESTDSLWLEPEEYAAAVRFFHARGIRTTTHAIGDKGIWFVAQTHADLAPNGTQHRIEHIETLPDEVLELIASSSVAASMQPTHCTHYTRADHTDNWSRRLGDERADRAWRIRDLRERGVIVALGSDWPIAPYDPRGTLAAATLRRPAGRPEVAPVQPAQALSAAAALDAHTAGWWRSVGEEGGALRAGLPADLTVFADDPLATDPDVFADSPVLLTVVGGEVVVDAVPAGAQR